MNIKNPVALALALCLSCGQTTLTRSLITASSRAVVFPILLFSSRSSAIASLQDFPDGMGMPVAQTPADGDAGELEQEIRDRIQTEVDNTFRRTLGLLNLALIFLLLLPTVAAVGAGFLLRKLAKRTIVAEQEIESLRSDTIQQLETIINDAKTVLYNLQSKQKLADKTLEDLQSQTALKETEQIFQVADFTQEALPDAAGESTPLSSVPTSEVIAATASAVDPVPIPVKSDEDRAISYAKKGDKLFLENRFEDAIAFYNKALKLHPELAEVWNNRGVVLTRLQRYNEAIASYEKAIKMRSNYSEAWNNRGVALGKLNYYDAAVSSYDQAIHIKSDYMDAWNNRGFALAKLKKYDEAISSYNHAAKIKPDFYRIWYNKARCYALQGQVDLAIENLIRAAKHNSQIFQKLVSKEPDFDGIRQDEKFQKLIDECAVKAEA